VNFLNLSTSFSNQANFSDIKIDQANGFDYR